MPGVNYVKYGCFSARIIPEISLYRSLTREENTVAVIVQDKVIEDNLKRQIKNRTLYTCRLFLLTQIILAIGQKHLSIYPPYFFNIATQGNKFSKFS